MTVSTEIDHNEYTGNGATTSFPYTFRIMKNSDLVVQVVDLNENITQLLLDTDYSVTGAKGYSGGSVVLNSPLANGWQISINRSLPVTQDTDLRNQGKFFAEVHEDAFDKLTMLIQQCFSRLRLSLRRPSFIANYYDALGYYIRNLRDPSRAQDAATKNYVDVLAQNNLNRSLRVPEGYIAPLPPVDLRKNKIVAMDGSGNPIMVLPESGSAADVLIELAQDNGATHIGGSVYVVNSYNDALYAYPAYSKKMATRGHHIIGIGAAVYVRDGSSGPSSTGNEGKFYDAAGNGWVLDAGQKIDAKMFGMVGFGDNATDEAQYFLKALNFSAQTGLEINVSPGAYGFYLFGQVMVPGNTRVNFSYNSQIKARDDLKQIFTNESSFEVLFRFQDTQGAVWHCNKARFYYDKTKYSGEHNHVFMFDGASDLYIYDPNAYNPAGDGYYVGGRFSVNKHCTNVKLFRPVSFQARRNGLSVISCDGLFVHEYDFVSTGRNGNNSSGPCAGIDVEPETYTDALRASFYNGRTIDSLRPGTVVALTKLQQGVVVKLDFFNPYSYNDSRGFEVTRVKAVHEGLIRLTNPVAEKSRFSSFHGINSAATGVLFEIIDPLVIDPSVSTEAQNGGGSPYYFNNFNDGSSEDIYPQVVGGIRVIRPGIKYISSFDRPNFCVRVNITSPQINAVKNIQADNIRIIDPLFRKSDYTQDAYNCNVIIPAGYDAAGYNPFLDMRFDNSADYRKDVGSGFNARSIPGGYFSNLGQSSAMTLNLNEAIVGRSFEIAVLSGNTLTVNPAGANIYPLIMANTGAQRINSNVVGSRIRLLCEDVNGVATWMIKETVGTWNVS